MCYPYPLSKNASGSLLFSSLCDGGRVKQSTVYIILL